MRLDGPGGHQQGHITILQDARLADHHAVPVPSQESRDAVSRGAGSIHGDAQALGGCRSVAQQRGFQAAQ